MFDLVAKHKRIAQLILFLIMVPFAFFGVDYYFRGGAQDDAVASVKGDKITQNEYADAVREQTDQMRRQMGRNFDPRMFENPEVRFAILDNLINQKLLAQKARDEKFRVSDAQLQQFIMSVPTFQDDGKFSADRYRMWLASQSMNPLYFEQRLRSDLMTGAVQAMPIDQVVDVTGAGDLFAAGFLFGLVRNAGHENAGRLGALAAAEVIQHIGARPQVSLKELAKQNGLPV